MLMCLRYLASGTVLLVGAGLSGARFPTVGELWRTALYGIITIGVGTGSLAWVEQWVPSGLASLLVSLQPFWMVAMESLVPGGERLHWPAIRGMLVGLAGVAFLVAPGAGGIKTAGMLSGFLIIQLGAVMWSAGSIAQRRLGGRAHPFVSGGVQQLATGLAFAIPALLEPRHAVWASKGVAAIVYLAIFGGIIGYSAYIYAMHHLPVALVSIYTYINPLVAVLLGWLFYREAFGWREAVAMAIIFVGVGMVKRAAARRI